MHNKSIEKMTNEIQQKSNYRLYYAGEHQDYSVKGQHPFYAFNDNLAIKEAKIFIEDLSKKNNLNYTLTKLEKIAYVLKEVEETIPISL